MAVNVRDFGAIGDGVADDTVAIQLAINSLTKGGVCTLPGTAAYYRTTAPLMLNGGYGVILTGEGAASLIAGSFDGYVLDRNIAGISDVGGPLIIERLQVRNNFATGGGVRITGIVNARIDACRVSAFKAVVAQENTFGLRVSNVRCVPALGGPPAVGSIGILTGGHTTIEAADIAGFDHAVRACGAGVTVIGSRFEVNRVGLMLGMDAGGADHILSRGFFAGLSFEANDAAIYCQNLVSSEIAGFGVQGSAGAPSGASQYGIRAHQIRWSKVCGAEINGTYAQASVAIEYAAQTVFSAVKATNVPAPAWVLPAGQSGLLFEQCNQ